MIKTYTQQVKDIKTNGITYTDRKADFKLKLLAYDYLVHKSYRSRKSAIRECILKCGDDYFTHLSDDEKENTLNAIMHDACCDEAIKSLDERNKVDLYVDEMETIMNIEDDNLRKMAFASLVVFKYCSTAMKSNRLVHYPYTVMYEADIVELAGYKRYSKKCDYFFYQLHQMDLIKTRVKKGRTSAKLEFTIPFAQNSGEVWKTIDDDLENAMLYLRLYEGDKRVKECERCGRPIEIKLHGNTKKLCSHCA